MKREKIAKAINILGAFCGMRDIPELSKSALEKGFGIPQADVMVLFGGSILCGGDELAKAMQNGIARRYVIVGGEGHTTEALRGRINREYPEIDCNGLSEAEIFAAYLQRRYGLEPDFLECRSSNCGNNITCLLELLKTEGVSYHSVILMQDATMQRRMDAAMRKYSKKTVAINYASYVAHVVVSGEEFRFDSDIAGMWEMERYINLLLGEIPRLRDDADGYGPNGRGYIAHVDIPDEVQHAFSVLRQEYGGAVREANPLFAKEK